MLRRSVAAPRWLVAGGVASLVASACARQAAPPADPPLPPMPKITEAPPGTKSCAETLALVEAAGRLSAPVRAVFAGCYAPSCPPCPPEVNCSPCEAGWCELTSDDESCAIRVQLSFDCRPETGRTYVFGFAAHGGSSAGPEIASCAELTSAPRITVAPPSPTGRRPARGRRGPDPRAPRGARVTHRARRELAPK